MAELIVIPGEKPKQEAARKPDAALVQLKKRAREQMVARGAGVPEAPTERVSKWRSLLNYGGVTPQELVVFTRQFATMIDAGLPLLQSLNVQARRNRNPYFRERLMGVVRLVRGGARLSVAMKKYPEVFDGLYTSMIAAGEAGGVMDRVLLRTANYLEAAGRLRRQVKVALVYPTAILCVAIVVTALLLLKVVPVFDHMFGQFGEDLPMETQLVLQLSQVAQRYALTGMGLLIVLAAALFFLYRGDRGRLFIDGMILRIPLFGDIATKVAVARFCRTLGTLLGAGVGILTSLEICSKTAGNRVIEEAVMRARKGIQSGRSVAGPIRAAGVFPDMVAQMIAVGEATGALEPMLEKLADFYDTEVESAVEALVSLLEPALMIFLGVTIGSLLIAMYMPVFMMANAVGGG